MIVGILRALASGVGRQRHCIKYPVMPLSLMLMDQMSHIHVLSSGSSDDHHSFNKVAAIQMSTSWTYSWDTHWSFATCYA